MVATVLGTLSILAVPLLLGIGTGMMALFDDPDGAVGALNRYVLYLAFPALIVVGMLDRELALPSGAGFYLVVPGVAVLLSAVLLALRATPLRNETGAIALTSLFGNTAYVGLPVVEGVLGPQGLGIGAVAVAMHVTISMVVGPVLLLTWSGGESHGAVGAALRKVVRQPLAWAPVVGLVLRWLPGSAVLVDYLQPVGRSASPVGLFLIGLFLHTHGRGLSFGATAWLRVLFKLAVVPALTWGLVGVAGAFGLISTEGAAVLLLLSAMPTAISTFSIAREFDAAVDEVTVAVVLSTALCPLAISAVAALVG
ncbi:MAG: hypothetical protein EP330_15545 [Deltaproteobacteria bacterium]|nr:MAG: hypothetical protein EP330_15545 [Deltaproteobacteria bacterium]